MCGKVVCRLVKIIRVAYFERRLRLVCRRVCCLFIELGAITRPLMTDVERWDGVAAAAAAAASFWSRDLTDKLFWGAVKSARWQQTTLQLTQIMMAWDKHFMGMSQTVEGWRTILSVSGFKISLSNRVPCWPGNSSWVMMMVSITDVLVWRL